MAETGGLAGLNGLASNGRFASDDSPEPDKQAGNRLPSGRFPPGVSGNPKGRPRGRTLRCELRGVLDLVDINNTGTGLTARSHIARILVERALTGDLRAIALILAAEPQTADPAPPSVGPADTGRQANDLLSHFAGTGQMPLDEVDIPELYSEMLAVFESDTGTEFKKRLLTRLTETFGSPGEFAVAAGLAEHVAQLENEPT